MIERLLRRFVPFKEIGWEEIGEQFTRFQLVKTRWGNVYLHKLIAKTAHPHCHDHPWSFVAVLLKGGYWEALNGADWQWRPAGYVLWRPAVTRHNVVTKGTSWSLIFTTAKTRDWGFVESCRHEVQ